MFDHFGIIAPFYERLIPLKHAERVLKFLAPQPEHRILDVGGGTGRVSALLRDRARQVVVLDESGKMLAKAREKGGLGLARALSEQMPFADGAFERILMVDTMHHVIDHAQTARELWRVLAPNGRLVIKEPDVRKFSGRLVAWMEKALLMRSEFLPPPVIVTLFGSAPRSVQMVEDTADKNTWMILEK
ncbi:MAG: hypothetical protein OHK0052_25310 [Anaerolineales bacterium]